MKGKVLSYDTFSEEGVLEGRDGVHHPFSLMDCIEFPNDPRKGDPVEFGLDGGVPYYVKFLKNPSYEAEDEAQTLVPQQKKAPAKENDIYAPIVLDYSVEEAIFHYFSSLIVDLEEYDYDFEEYERLDYIRMRRFLTTAYHNLLDLDPKFVNNELISFYEYVGDIYRLYKGFVKKISIPKIAYEEIFLGAQTEYVWRKAKLESNRGEISTQKGVIKNLANEIERVKQKILKEPKEKVAFETEYKRYNRMYVDALHRAATLRDENIFLLRELKSFEEMYYGDFASQFAHFSRERKEQILRLLDGYSYYFDKKMWDCAESSRSIREFFRKANVQEEFSSKTYLKYYLKGLDELKMSELHRELKTLLSYLESLSQVSVAIVDEDKDAKFRLLKILRLQNSDVKASSYERVKLFAQRLKQEPFDLVIIDTKITNPSVEKSLEIIEEMQSKRTKKCRVCLMSTTFSKEELTRYSALGITNFLLKTLPEAELGRRLDELLEGLHVDQLKA
ncbi:MAG: response regulator [Campylobacterales bacterium]|nr:response regulator [Campylobacterales bacterium]